MKLKCAVCYISIIIFAECRLSEAGFWDWAFSSAKDDKKTTAIDYSMGSNLGKLVSVPFEMRTGDEKFIIEAVNYGLQASDLDICHHKVMMQLRKACGSITEEDVGKLSVHLLNCQSSVEKRRTYKCTEDMAISQCTKDMDPNTWNAYHIVSNRVRAVCYAARQQQFTAKAEMTVNKLLWSSEHQIAALQKLEDGQMKVGEMTHKTLETMVIGQRELKERQERLKASQKYIQTFVHGNLRELTRGKALIADIQLELAEMTGLIQNKLDEASQKMITNEDIRKSNHREILQDLSRVQSKAKEMWEKIDNSTQYILNQHSVAVIHYQASLENLERINQTVSYLLNLMNKTRIEVDQKLGWVTNLLWDAGDRLTVIYGCVIHGIYFLVSAITASFLNAPSLSRVCILIIIPLNALSEIKHQPSLDFYSLTLMLVSTLAVHWMIYSAKKALNAPQQMVHICYKIHDSVCKRLSKTSSRKKENTQRGFCNHSRRNSNCKLNSTDINQNENCNGELLNSTILENSISVITAEARASSPASTSTPKASSTTSSSELNDWPQSPSSDLLVDFDNVHFNDTVTRSRRVSNTSTSSKKSCSGFNRSGLPCKASVTSVKDYCFRHIDQQSKM